MIKYLFFLSFFLSSIFASNAFISPSELKTSLEDKNLIIIDVDKKSLFTKGHIENSVNANVLAFIDKPINVNPNNLQNLSLQKKMNLASSRVIQKELRRLGINKDSKIIIYDHNTDDGMQKSAFLAFVLIHSGFDDVQILDGGYMSWVFQNQILVSTNISKVEKYGNIEVQPRKQLLINTSYLKKNISKVKILDTRSPRHYFGVLKSNKIDRLGHIPKAMSSFDVDKFHIDYTLRKQEELDAIYLTGHELKNSDEIIVYSDNLINSAMEWYILYKQMGFINTKIYENSLLEWGNNNYPLIKFKWE
ncbi:MAG: rhodanese-like domain-containing protein [Campylobacterota bacterium]|nr:rhodanese-like domain-containing protein [Campylobacterota bacterium]